MAARKKNDRKISDLSENSRNNRQRNRGRGREDSGRSVLAIVKRNSTGVMGTSAFLEPFLYVCIAYFFRELYYHPRPLASISVPSSCRAWKHFLPGVIPRFDRATISWLDVSFFFPSRFHFSESCAYMNTITSHRRHRYAESTQLVRRTSVRYKYCKRLILYLDIYKLIQEFAKISKTVNIIRCSNKVERRQICRVEFSEEVERSFNALSLVIPLYV